MKKNNLPKLPLITKSLKGLMQLSRGLKALQEIQAEMKVTKTGIIEGHDRTTYNGEEI